MSKFSRRRFIQSGVSVSAAAFVACDGNQMSMPAPEMDAPPQNPLQVGPIGLVRIGLIGLGARGMGHFALLQELDGAEIAAICDIDPSRISAARELARDAGTPQPAGFENYEEMIAQQNLDLVVVITPWEDHVPMSVAALNAGMHVATEVPAAISIDECWELVAAAEKSGRHCIMLENVNYGRPELTVLNFVRQGLLGEINYCEGSYEHDLRAERLDPARHNPPYWRLNHAIRRNANLYPTHGLGPLANCLNINRGDRFCRLTAFSSPASGLNRYANEELPEGSLHSNTEFACGDYVVALIHTVKGSTVYLTYNTSSPRPYSRRHLVHGDRGIFQGYPDRIHIDDLSPAEQWENPETYFTSYKPTLWEQWDNGQANNFRTVGHGGNDNVMWLRLIDLFNKGLPMDMDVYDATVLSVVTELTEISISNGGVSVEFPDFTRGRWHEWSPQSYGLE